MPTDVPKFITELDAGVFEKKIAVALGEVSAAVMDHEKAGSVTIKFDLAQLGSSNQVMIKHKLSFVKPTNKGKVSEENNTESPMYIGKSGYLSMFPEDQTQMFTKTGAINSDVGTEK